VDLSSGKGEANDPPHQFTIQSIMNLPSDFQLDLTGRYVDRLPSPNVPSYITFDARLAWEFRKHLELSVVGQNLWGSHPEFGPAGTRYEVPRSVFGKVTWRF
jgi:iron complex outermembrane receptor protein